MADVTPPDYTTPVGQIRVFINDTVQRVDPANPAAGAQYLFSDAQIAAVNGLALNIKFAAASLLDAIATNEATVAKKIRTESLQTDGAAVANAVRLHADSLRTEARLELERTDAAADTIEIVDFSPSPTQEDYRELGLLGPMPYGGPYYRWI